MLALEMRFIEAQNFTEEACEVATYTRCFFDPILVGDSDSYIRVYPIAKIYSNGVCIVSLRVFSPDREGASTREFWNCWAMSRQHFESILVSPSLLLAAPKADLLAEMVALKPDMLAQMSPEELAKALTSDVVAIEEMGVERPMFRLNAEQLTGYFVADVIWVLLDGCIDALAMRPPRLTWASFKLSKVYERDWFGHSTAFLIKWAGQPYRADKMSSFEGSIARILFGAPDLAASATKDYLKRMPRMFDDYVPYVSRASSVYAFSAKYLESAEEQDEAYQRLALSNQVTEEFALWVMASYRSLDKSVTDRSTPAELSKIAEEKRMLDRIRLRLTHFGELDDFVSEYLLRLGADQDVARLEKGLENQMQRQKELLAARLTRFSTYFGVILAVIGSGQLADRVITPLRAKGWRFPLVPGVDSKISDYFLAMAIIVLVVVFVWFVASIHRKR